MKISNEYHRYQDLSSKQANHISNQSAATTSKSTSVEVALSDTSKQLRAGEIKSAEAGSDKVAELKKAIQNGTYKVSAEQLATKMMESFNK